MDWYSKGSSDGGKTWGTPTYNYSKPIYSTISITHPTGELNTTLGNLNDGFSAAGIAFGSAELYTNTYSPVQIAYTTINGTHSTISSVKIVDISSTAGKYVLYAGITVDVSLSLAGYQSWGKTIVNTAISFLPLVIGTGPGLVVGVGYFVIDKTGVFDRPTNLTPYQPPLYAVPDATRVNIPIINP